MQSEQSPDLWLTPQQIARLLSMSRANWDRLRPRLASGDVRKVSRRIYISAAAAVRIYTRIELDRQARRLAPEGADPLLADAGGRSPALERYREERAILARLDRQEKQGDLLRREVVHQLYSRLAHMLRAAGQILQERYGAGANEAVTEALATFERSLPAEGAGTERIVG